jgi:hypothetical protein
MFSLTSAMDVFAFKHKAFSSRSEQNTNIEEQFNDQNKEAVINVSSDCYGAGHFFCPNLR